MIWNEAKCGVQVRFLNGYLAEIPIGVDRRPFTAYGGNRMLKDMRGMQATTGMQPVGIRHAVEHHLSAPETRTCLLLHTTYRNKTYNCTTVKLLRSTVSWLQNTAFFQDSALGETLFC